MIFLSILTKRNDTLIKNSLYMIIGIFLISVSCFGQADIASQKDVTTDIEQRKPLQLQPLSQQDPNQPLPAQSTTTDKTSIKQQTETLKKMSYKNLLTYYQTSFNTALETRSKSDMTSLVLAQRELLARNYSFALKAKTSAQQILGDDATPQAFTENLLKRIKLLFVVNNTTSKQQVSIIAKYIKLLNKMNLPVQIFCDLFYTGEEVKKYLVVTYDIKIGQPPVKVTAPILIAYDIQTKKYIVLDPDGSLDSELTRIRNFYMQLKYNILDEDVNL